MTEAEETTLEEFVEQILDVVEANPGAVNPTRGPTCLYDDGRGSHCLLGQWMVDNGRELPTNNPAFGVLPGLRLDALARDLGDALQAYADGGERGGPVPWGEAIRRAVADCAVDDPVYGLPLLVAAAKRRGLV